MTDQWSIYAKYIDKYIRSADMRGYLKTDPCSVDTIVDVICCAQVSITDKLADLQEIQQIARDQEDYELAEIAETAARTLDLAVRGLDEKGIFIVELLEYCENTHDIHSCGITGVYATWQLTGKGLQREMQVCRIKPDDNCWFEIAMWKDAGDGTYQEMYDYTVINGVITGAEFGQAHPKYHDPSLARVSGRELNLPVPFLPGDMIEIDPYPYGGKYQAVVCDIGDNRDCCCVQVLSIDENGKYRMGALKHGFCGSMKHFSQPSPLLTARKCTDEECRKDELFAEVQQSIIEQSGKSARH